MDKAPEKELHFPVAPWRDGSYEHVTGKDWPDVAQTPAAKAIAEKFPESFLGFTGYRGDPCVLLRKDKIVDILKFLRDGADLQFDFLRDLFAMDNLQTESRRKQFSDLGFKEVARFEVIYILYSLRFRHDIRLRVAVSEEDANIQSAFKVFKGANWYEREAWEMYGVNFVGHPNLRRLITHESFEGHPLRKDYPIRRRHNIIKPVDIL